MPRSDSTAQLCARWCRHTLHFRFTAITSRERMTRKDTYYIQLFDPSRPEVTGLGEAALFPGLSPDPLDGYEEMMQRVCADPARFLADTSLLGPYSSIRMGLETAAADLANGGCGLIHPSPWSRGEISIRINGLVWMGDKETMASRIDSKLSEGFSCIKIKIGGIDFGHELDLLRHIRSLAPSVELRLDANGAFPPGQALERLEALSHFDIHSIEQPIAAGQWDEMARICRLSPIPIALDEELIGLDDTPGQEAMLDAVRPAYIILKPTLCGGFAGADRWINLARERGIGWWATSALESNVGLNAIAQWVATHPSSLPQGLGTGQLFTDNIPSPLRLVADRLSLDPDTAWDIPQLPWK